ncbi:MAG: secretion system protein E [Candidatus Aenigmarchaeota archaeon ex4484_224]|nr:MAG: secretion system protein E [Candidatus Aenigmarchaeota archaeon ex4484_224]
MKLKGLLYRKLIKREFGSEEIKEYIPVFKIGSSKRIFEIKRPQDITKTNISYPLIEPFSYAHIHWNDKEKLLIYEVLEPELKEDEKEKLEKISSSLVEIIDTGFGIAKDREKAIKYLEEKVQQVLRNLGMTLTTIEYLKIMYYIYRDFIGLNEIEPLMNDPNIEDISCDGVNIPIYVVHRIFGSLKTNVMFKDTERLRQFIVKLAERCGRYVSYAEPILDATLPDGSRVAATIASDVATKGPTFTIRKFSERPFSPVDQIYLGTVNAEIMAYFWYIIEHRASILIVGGTATGKTSFLNSISCFIRPEAKIVSIEDTRELRLPHEHWIPSLSRIGFGIPLPTGEKYGEVTLFDLLKESFRQNPDYVIVGETRGKEAYVMFQGMSSGHASMSTFHAGSLEAAIKRLISPPISLPPQLLESLDVVAVMGHYKEKGGARRLKQVVEIKSVDVKSGEVIPNLVYKWDPVSDTFKKINESVVVRKIAESIGQNYKEAFKEIENRKKVLEWLYQKGIRDFDEVNKWINRYYKEKEKVLKEIGEVKEEKRVEKPKEIPKPKERKLERRISIIDLLGLKLIKTKI